MGGNVRERSTADRSMASAGPECTITAEAGLPAKEQPVVLIASGHQR